jgi:tetratricopeptide (TPR) repeat protein
MQHEYDAAIEDCTQAIILKPNCEGAYGKRGMAYYRKGDTARAIQDLERAINLDPDYQWAKDRLAEIQNGTTTALVESGSGDDSEQDAEKERITRLLRKGQTCLEKDEFERADRYFRKALDLDETCWPAWQGISAVAAEDNDYPTAIRYMDSAKQYAKEYGNKGAVKECNAAIKILQQWQHEDKEKMKARMKQEEEDMEALGGLIGTALAALFK